MPRIACLHTAESNVAVFEAALRDIAAEEGAADEPVALRHEVRADLLARAEAAGGLTPALAADTVEALRTLGTDADAVILTCSTLGPAASGHMSVPVRRVDAALARAAVAAGGAVTVLCAVETTLAPTRWLFEAAAAQTGARIEVRLAPGAWAAFKAGDGALYASLVARAADDAVGRGASCVALAQASMAAAAKRARTVPAPLTSPAAGLRAAIAAARRTP